MIYVNNNVILIIFTVVSLPLILILFHSSCFVDLGWVNSNLLNWFLIVQFLSLHNSDSSHSVYDTSKDNILFIHLSQRCWECDIELAFIGISITLSLTHTEESWLIVLLGKAFIGEFAIVEDWAGSWQTEKLIDITSLNKFTLDNSVKIGVNIRDILLIRPSFESCAKWCKVLTSFWAYVVEKLNQDSLRLGSTIW